jgi:hypothetical protein
MKYMLLMHYVEDDEDEAGPQDAGQVEDEQVEDEQAKPCWLDWFTEITERSGVSLLNGGKLQPSTTATTVRANGSEVLVADGPFAETKEQIGGFDVIECADLDEAIYVASRHPVAQFGVIEVRPMMGGPMWTHPDPAP